MGNNRSQQQYNVTQPLGPEWKLASHTPHCTILQNALTKEQAELYSSVVPKSSISRQLQIYQYRNINAYSKNIIGVYHVAEAPNQNNATICTGDEAKRMTVLTQRIPLLLADAPPLSHPQALFVLHESLYGFDELYQKQGFFNINDRMIGFNQNGRIKVWLNQEYESNHLNNSNPMAPLADSSIPRSEQETRMVVQLIKIIQSHSQNPFPAQFHQCFALTHPANFPQAINFVRDYANEQRIMVPGQLSQLILPHTIAQKSFHAPQAPPAQIMHQQKLHALPIRNHTPTRTQNYVHGKPNSVSTHLPIKGSSISGIPIRQTIPMPVSAVPTTIPIVRTVSTNSQMIKRSSVNEAQNVLKPVSATTVSELPIPAQNFQPLSKQSVVSPTASLVHQLNNIKVIQPRQTMRNQSQQREYHRTLQNQFREPIQPNNTYLLNKTPAVYLTSVPLQSPQSLSGTGIKNSRISQNQAKAQVNSRVPQQRVLAQAFSIAPAPYIQNRRGTLNFTTLLQQNQIIDPPNNLNQVVTQQNSIPGQLQVSLNRVETRIKTNDANSNQSKKIQDSINNINQIFQQVSGKKVSVNEQQSRKNSNSNAFSFQQIVVSNFTPIQSVPVTTYVEPRYQAPRIQKPQNVILPQRFVQQPLPHNVAQMNQTDKNQRSRQSSAHLEHIPSQVQDGMTNSTLQSNISNIVNNSLNSQLVNQNIVNNQLVEFATQTELLDDSPHKPEVANTQPAPSNNRVPQQRAMNTNFQAASSSADKNNVNRHHRQYTFESEQSNYIPPLPQRAEDTYTLKDAVVPETTTANLRQTEPARPVTVLVTSPAERGSSQKRTTSEETKRILYGDTNRVQVSEYKPVPAKYNQVSYANVYEKLKPVNQVDVEDSNNNIYSFAQNRSISNPVKRQDDPILVHNYDYKYSEYATNGYNFGSSSNNYSRDYKFGTTKYGLENSVAFQIDKKYETKIQNKYTSGTSEYSSTTPRLTYEQILAKYSTKPKTNYALAENIPESVSASRQKSVLQSRHSGQSPQHEVVQTNSKVEEREIKKAGVRQSRAKAMGSKTEHITYEDLRKKLLGLD